MTARLARALRLAAVACLLAPGAAYADHPFILPSSTSVSGDNTMVTFDAAGSDHVFFFDHRPMQLETITITKPDGTPATPANPFRGRFRSVFDLRLDQPGTWDIVGRQTMVMGSFKLNGEERRVGGRGGPPPGGANASSGERGPGGDRGAGGDSGRPDARGPQAGPGGAPGGAPDEPRRLPPVALADIPAEATDIHLTEMIAVAETFVTSGAPTKPVTRPTGTGIALDPITHPNALVAGETARLRFLIDGKPAAAIKVTVLPGGDRYRDDDGAVTQTTGPDGVAVIKWPTAGMYWVSAEAEDTHPAEKRAEARRMTYSATLEVMTP